jgi:hypothetical protein
MPCLQGVVRLYWGKVKGAWIQEETDLANAIGAGVAYSALYRATAVSGIGINSADTVHTA